MDNNNTINKRKGGTNGICISIPRRAGLLTFVFLKLSVPGGRSKCAFKLFAEFWPQNSATKR